MNPFVCLLDGCSNQPQIPAIYSDVTPYQRYCSSCFHYYCCRDHFEADLDHKLVCRSVTLNHAQVFLLPRRQGIRATRLIRTGAVILNELPLILISNVSGTQPSIPSSLVPLILEAMFISNLTSEHPLVHAVFSPSDHCSVEQRFGSSERQEKILRLFDHTSHRELEFISNADLSTQEAELSKKWIYTFVNNSFSGISPLTQVETGTCLMTIGSQFGYSTTPNAGFRLFADNLVVYALRDIAPGDEIVIDRYSDKGIITPRERRKNSQYNRIENGITSTYYYDNETIEWMSERAKFLRFASIFFNDSELYQRAKHSDLVALKVMERASLWVKGELTAEQRFLRHSGTVSEKQRNQAIYHVFLKAFHIAITTILVRTEVRDPIFMSEELTYLIHEIKKSQRREILDVETTRFVNLQKFSSYNMGFVTEPLMSPIINNILELIMLRKTLGSDSFSVTKILKHESGRRLIQDLIRRLRPLLPGPWYPVSHFFVRHIGHSGVLRFIFMMIRQYELEPKQFTY